MKRPTGVTILALLNFASAVLAVFGGIFLGLGVAISGIGLGLVAQRSHENPLGQGLIGGGILVGVLIFLAALFVAIASIVVGIGLWRLWNWTRLLTIVLSGVTAALCAVALLLELITFQFIAAFFSLIFLGVCVLIIVYLFQPHVRQAFRPARSPAIMPAAAAADEG